jgi:hypothetical protein
MCRWLEDKKGESQTVVELMKEEDWCAGGLFWQVVVFEGLMACGRSG